MARMTSETSAPKASIPAIPARTSRLGFERNDWQRLFGYYGVVLLLHLAGWGLYLAYAAHQPALVGLGLAAYAFGLRHAFDADHIAAVDDTVRLMLARGSRPLGVGFYFSLGHSSVVLLLAIGIGCAASVVKQYLSSLQEFGSVIGAAVSGTFLCIVGLLNLMVFIGMLKAWRGATVSGQGHHHMDQLLAERGFMNRLLRGRLSRSMTRDWHMFPVGFLFGLGFDTASEIALLAMMAGATAGNLPIAATLCLPILFAAGMSLMDTTDGVLMVKAYNWAFINPLRKIFYNLTTTGLSVAIALVIGAVELVQVAIEVFHPSGALFQLAAGIDFAWLGYAVVAAFMALWILSALIWRLRRRRATHLPSEHSVHRHPDGSVHSHRHYR
jgi:high-affinity nickel-transport protein